MTIAEESTAWPQVTRPPYLAGWLLLQVEHGVDARHSSIFPTRAHPSKISSERSHLRDALPSSREFHPAASHDEVVHGKGSLLSRMPGDDWQKFANLRALLGFECSSRARCCCLWAENSGNARMERERRTGLGLAGGGSLSQRRQKFVQDLNQLYLAEAGLWQSDFDTDGFQWIDALDNQNSVLSFLRRDSERVSELAVILNLTPVARLRYRLGLPRPGKWLEVLNSDAAITPAATWETWAA